MTARLPHRRSARHALAALLVTLAAALALAPAAAEATPHKRVTVMTQNLYLGASLDPALAATTPPELFAAVAQIFGSVQATNFPARAERIADQIRATRPDLVGLQEVSLWRSGPLELPPTPPTPAQRVEFDFLTTLLTELAERGQRYRVVAVTRNADIELPSPLTGQDLRLTDRDVILARENRRRGRLKLSNVQEETFAPAAQLSVPTVAGTLEFTRGWNSVDVKVQGRRFRFINTHLEVQAGAPFQVAQAQELLDGPADTRLPVVMVGDFNSNADPANPDTATYANLIGAGFRDAWSRARPGEDGFTCCHAADLLNPVPALDERIDLILTRPAIRVRRAVVLGDEPGDRTATDPSLWPSDHAGVVAKLALAPRGRGRRWARRAASSPTPRDASPGW